MPVMAGRRNQGIPCIYQDKSVSQAALTIPTCYRCFIITSSVADRSLNRTLQIFLFESLSHITPNPIASLARLDLVIYLGHAAQSSLTQGLGTLLHGCSEEENIIP